MQCLTSCNGLRSNYDLLRSIAAVADIIGASACPFQWFWHYLNEWIGAGVAVDGVCFGGRCGVGEERILGRWRGLDLMYRLGSTVCLRGWPFVSEWEGVWVVYSVVIAINFMSKTILKTIEPLSHPLSLPKLPLMPSIWLLIFHLSFPESKITTSCHIQTAPATTLIDLGVQRQRKCYMNSWNTEFNLEKFLSSSHPPPTTTCTRISILCALCFISLRGEWKFAIFTIRSLTAIFLLLLRLGHKRDSVYVRRRMLIERSRTRRRGRKAKVSFFLLSANLQPHFGGCSGWSGWSVCSADENRRRTGWLSIVTECL